MSSLMRTVMILFPSSASAAGSVSKFDGQFAKPAIDQANLNAAIGALTVGTSKLSIVIDDTDIQNNGIALKYTITEVGAPQYNGSSISAFQTVTKTTEKGKTFTISAEEIKTSVALNGSISLPTYADYQAFQRVLPSVLLSITVEAADSVTGGQ